MAQRFNAHAARVFCLVYNNHFLARVTNRLTVRFENFGTVL